MSSKRQVKEVIRHRRDSIYIYVYLEKFNKLK